MMIQSTEYNILVSVDGKKGEKKLSVSMLGFISQFMYRELSLIKNIKIHQHSLPISHSHLLSC